MKVRSKITSIAKRLFQNDLRELLGHSTNYISADVIIMLVSFFLMPIITRLLSTEEYGYMSIYLTLLSVFNIVFLMGIDGAININYVNKQYPHRDYLFTNLVFSFLLSVFLFILMIFFLPYISVKYGIPEYILIAAALTSMSGIFFSIQIGLFQVKKQSRKFAWLLGSKQVIILLISLAAIWYLSSERHYGRVYTTLIITLVFSAYSAWCLFKEGGHRFVKKYAVDALLFSLPIMPHILSGFILKLFDQMIINELVGASATGLYAFAYTIGMTLLAIVSSINRAFQPMFWSYIQEENFKGINKLARFYGKIIYMCAIGLIFFAREIVIIIADEKYYESYKIIPFVAFSYVFVFLYNLYGSIAFYKKKTWLISMNTIVAAAINIILNYIFIPIYGYKVAAINTLISYMVLFIMHYIGCRYLLKFKLINPSSVFPDFIFLTGVMFVYLAMDHFICNTYVLLPLKILVVGLSCVYLFFSQIKGGIQKMV